MTTTIWKFTLEITDRQTIQMPAGARFLNVAEQRNQPCLWAVVDPTQPTEDREIAIYGTGQPITGELGVYVGTVQTHGENLVWHVFDPMTKAPVLERIDASITGRPFDDLEIDDEN